MEHNILWENTFQQHNSENLTHLYKSRAFRRPNVNLQKQNDNNQGSLMLYEQI